jgi:hypothetical protein
LGGLGADGFGGVVQSGGRAVIFGQIRGGRDLGWIRGGQDLGLIRDERTDGIWGGLGVPTAGLRRSAPVRVDWGRTGFGKLDGGFSFFCLERRLEIRMGERDRVKHQLFSFFVFS